MKKYLVIFILLTIFLTGCTQNQPTFVTGNETLKVTILDNNGSPLGNIEVDLWQNDDINRPPNAGYTSTDQNGVATFKVPAGKYYVGFNSNNFPDKFVPVDKQLISVETGIENVKTINLVLK